jgi:hypothetical protein
MTLGIIPRMTLQYVEYGKSGSLVFYQTNQILTSDRRFRVGQAEFGNRPYFRKYKETSPTIFRF